METEPTSPKPPAPPRRKLATRRTWLVAAALAILAAAGTGLYLNSHVTVPYFSWVKAQGWDVQPVHVVRLEPKWLMRFERVPDTPSQRELMAFRASWNSMGRPTIAVRQAYERVLAQYPHFFYAEYEIAGWYQENNDPTHYRVWLEQSLRDAPAVLAGRVVYDNGTPAANVTCKVRITSRNRRDLDNHTMMGWYNSVTTDSEGCYYLPVFKGIYSSINSIGLNQLAATDAQSRVMNLYSPGPAFSGFANQFKPNECLVAGAVSVSRVGVLPEMIARPNIQILLPAVPTVNDEKHPAIVAGNVLDLKWTPVPGAVRYTVDLQPAPQGDRVFQVDNTHSQNALAPTELKIPLDGTDGYYGKAPLFNRNQVYSIVIWAHGSDDTRSTDDMANVSEWFYFLPSGAAAPEAITRENFLRALGSGCSITSFVTQGNQVMIAGTVPVGTINNGTMILRLEPLFGQPDDEGVGGNFTLGPENSQGQPFNVTFTKPSN